MKILNVVGARPNLIKIAPIVEEIKKYNNLQQILIHTGQHFDFNMSEIFFDELRIPRPDIYLDVGAGSHAVQTARIMIAFEKVILEIKPDMVILVGDVNSTIACAVTAAKLWIPIVHVEAGLRSFDRTMPEEINRIVTDALSEFLFTTVKSAKKNLLKEGIPAEKIYFVGNIMIDTLHKHSLFAKNLNTPKSFGLEPKSYALLTLHRPSNVDFYPILAGILKAIEAIQSKIPILFPAHPRTVKQLKDYGLKGQLEKMSNLKILDPLGYLEFLDLMMHAMMVLTDSGGIQEETTVLKVPCLTIRENTERPITVELGTNIIVGTSPDSIIANAKKVLAGNWQRGQTPELWDGKAASRIVSIISNNFC